MKRAFLASIFIIPTIALAHGGGLDANGCHHDRKRGGYHCHNGHASPAPRPYLSPSFVQPKANTNDENAHSNAPIYDSNIETAQRLLISIGYDTGSNFGILDEQTIEQIIAFQTDEGLPINIVVDSQLIGALIAKRNLNKQIMEKSLPKTQ